MKLLLKLVALVLLGSVGNASAFVGAEHKWFSRKAICVALVHLERAGGEPVGRDKQAIDALSSLLEGKGTVPDYGQLVAYGDYVTFPNEMIDSSRSGPERIASVHVHGRTESVFAEYTEMLRNPHHFRELGLSHFHIWHDIAIARSVESTPEGRESDPLYDALAYNGYADHFLEDFFAPGHMIREPDGLSHMGTLRVHDTENWTGRDFQPAAGTREVLGNVLGSTSEEQEAIVSRCFNERDDITVADLEQALDSQPVHMQGDNQVYRKKQGIGEGRKRQALFVVLVVSRSILDIVDSYTLAERKNTFPNIRCPALPPDSSDALSKPFSDGCYFVVEETDESPSLAGISLGHYVSEPQAFVGDWTRYFSAELGTGYSYVNKGALEPGGRGDYSGHGFDVRFYIRAKQLYMFAAAEFGWRWYHGLGTRSNNPRIAGRLGFGNGIFWAYGSISSDERLTAQGRDDTIAMGFGISMTIPSTRILGWAAGH